MRATGKRDIPSDIENHAAQTSTVVLNHSGSSTMLTRSHHRARGFLTGIGSNRQVLSISKIDEFLLAVESTPLLMLDEIDASCRICRGHALALDTSKPFNFFCSPSSSLSPSLFTSSPLELVIVSEEEVNDICGRGG